MFGFNILFQLFDLVLYNRLEVLGFQTLAIIY